MGVQQVFTGVVGVVGACLFGGMPAKASPRLQTWQFDTGQNCFMFTTEGGVQPQVSLGQHPNRLIIDLPGVVTDEAVADQFIGGAVWAVKVMQVDARTTRMVLELDPSYTIDPRQVRVWGLTESQWVVQLPSLTPGQPISEAGSAAAAGMAWTSAAADFTPGSPSVRHPSTKTWPSHALPHQPLPKASESDNAPGSSRSAAYSESSEDSEDAEPIQSSPQDASPSPFFTLRPEGRTAPAPSLDGEGQSKANSSARATESTIPHTTHRPTAPATISPFPFPSARPATPQPPPDPAEVNLHLSPRTNTSPLPPLLSRNQVSYAPVTTVATVIQGIQATPQGFFMPLAGASPQVQVYRTRDAHQMRQIVIDVLNAAIPSQLTADALPVPRYGISRWTLTQFPTLPPAVRITLNLDNVSPDWQVSPVAGGLMITPIGMAAQHIATAPTTVVLPVLHAAPGSLTPSQTAYSSTLAAVAQAQPTVTPLPQRGQVLVMIDPGHGGADPGAVGIGGLQEKVVVTAVSHHVVQALSRQGIAVQMTRQGDETLDLQPRVDRAAAANATLFVSIHANAVNMQRPEVNGLETYYFSEASLPLANTIHRRVMSSVSMNDRGVKQARFFVLRRTTMPAALIEIGFVTGALDAPKLRDPQWQAQMGQAIAQGIVDYLQGGGR